MLQRKNERGNAIIVGLSLLALIGFATMAVDVGFAETQREELQATIDASALAAVGELNGSTTGMTRAVEMAKAMALRNEVMGTPYALADADIVLGSYDPGSGAFAVETDPELVNAVRITRASDPVMPFFSLAAFGDTMTVGVEGLAHRPWDYGPAGSVNCYLPVAVPDCLYTPGTQMNLKFQFGNDNDDNIAWADPLDANASNVKNQLGGACDGDSMRLGDTLEVSNGQLNTALKMVTDILENKESVSPDAWDGDLWGGVPLRDGTSANTPSQSSVGNTHYGNVIQGPVALVDAAACSGTKFTGEFTITGFAWGAIYDTRETSGGGVKQNMWMFLDAIDNGYEVWGDYDPDATGNLRTLGHAQLVD